MQGDLPDRIGAYRVEGLLGVGGTSTVYRARHESLDRQVALKVFRVGQDLPENALMRLQREARLVAKLDHECVVRCWDFGSDKDLFFLALEYVPGGSLKDAIDREGPLSEDRVRAVALDVARALRHAHEFGIVHRDVKPGNVLVTDSGRVKLTDFGLARTAEDFSVTQPGTTVGTPQYLSPEQARNPRAADARADLYSLGATLYHALTGLPPHRGDTLAQVITHILFGKVDPPERLRPGISPAFSRIVAKLMAKDRTKRYRDAAELTQDLRKLAGHDGADPAKIGLAWDDALRPQRSLSRVGAWAGISVALVVGSWFAWSVAHRTSASESIGSPSIPLPGVDDVRSGKLSLASAFEQALSARLDARQQGVLRDLESLAGEQAALVAVRAGAAARRELARGGIDGAMARFDDETQRESQHLFGRLAHELPEPLRRALDERVDDERVAVDELVFSARRAVTAEVTSDIDGLTRSALELLDAGEFAGALTLLSGERDRVDDRLDRAFAKGLRTAVPGADNAAPTPEWRADARERARADIDALTRRVNERVEEQRAGAIAAIAAFTAEIGDADLDGAHGAQSEAGLARRIAETAQEALGVALADFPLEPGPLQAAIDARAKELYVDLAQRERAQRERGEADALDAVEARLRAGDYAGAVLALAQLPAAPPPANPLLAELATIVPELARMEESAGKALEAEIGKPVRLVAKSGIVWNATLKSVDRAHRELRLDQNDATLHFGDLTRSELVARSGATPATAVVALLYADELDAAKKAIDGLAPDQLPAMRAEWRRRIDEKSEASALARSDADGKLAAFDAAVATAEPDAIVAAARALLDDSRLLRIDVVRARRGELSAAVDKAEKDARARKFRESIEQAVAGTVTFRADGTIEIRYGFQREGEIADFKRPGPEWGVRDGMLTSVTKGVESTTDLFRNRPGLRHELSFDPGKPLSIAFDLDVPLDGKDPGLVGIRVFSACFAIRSFGSGRYQGQANAWQGSLDEFEDYLFEPRLGETKPRKRGAHPVRPFALERGARYAVRVDWRPDQDGQVQLSIDGDVVYETRIGTRPRQGFAEIRSSVPVSIDDLVLIGTWADRR